MAGTVRWFVFTGLTKDYLVVPTAIGKGKKLQFFCWDDYRPEIHQKKHEYVHRHWNGISVCHGMSVMRQAINNHCDRADSTAGRKMQ
jgi:hypothetical protein